ncbi:MAG: helix-turn-helix domain-containing protein [Christensenellales bacterium]
MKLTQLIKTYNLNQTDFAKEIGVSQKTISNYLNGETEPTMSVLCKIADYFGVTLDYLCDHKTDIIDTSSYNSTAKGLVKKLPKLNSGNLDKLDAFCDGLIEGQK